MSRFLRRRARGTADRPGVSPEEEGQLIARMSVVHELVPLPDGEHVMIADGLSCVQMFSIRTGERVRNYEVNSFSARGIVLLGDDIFASISYHGSISVNSISNGTMFDQFKCDEILRSSAVLGDGYFLVGTSGGKVLEMHWDETSKLTHKRTLIACTHKSAPLIESISVCDNRLAVSTWEGDIVPVFDVTSFEHVGTVNVRRPNRVHLTELVLVIGCDSGKILVYNALTLNLLREMKIHSKCVFSVQVMADGRHVLSGGSDGLVSIHDINTGARIWRKQFNHWVFDTTLLLDARLATSFFQGPVVVHSIPQDIVQPMLTPAIRPSTPPREATGEDNPTRVGNKGIESDDKAELLSAGESTAAKLGPSS